MAFEIEIKGKNEGIKFNYRLMFKVNNKLASKDENGNSQGNGVSNLLLGLEEQNDEVLFDFLRIGLNKKFTEEDLFQAVEDYVEKHEDEEEGYQNLFGEVKEEMLDSGFFVQKIKKQIENMEKAITYLEGREDEDTKLQIRAIKDMIGRLNKVISSHNVQD